MHHTNKGRFLKVDSDKEPVLSSRYAIRGVPTIIVFKNEVEKGRVSGSVGEDDLENYIDKFL